MSETRALGDYFSKGALFSARLGVRVMSAAAICALLLAMAGLNGVMSQMVARRRRNRRRMALGARPGNVIALVAGHGTKLAVVGIAAGFAVAWWASLFITGKPAPGVFVMAAIFILAASIIAYLISNQARAGPIDPGGRTSRRINKSLL